MARMSADAGANSETWTISRLLSWTRDYLGQRAVDEPRLAAEILLAQALGCERIRLYTRFAEVPQAEKLAVFRELVRRAARHEPIAHLVGTKEFYSLPFEVSRAVLVPRPETEILVEKTIDYVRSAKGPNAEVRVLDIGTGSGCIAIALLKHLPAATALATDVSAEALAVARRNADRHGVSERLRLIEADRLNIPGTEFPAGGFDLLVSNPPYISADDLAGLAANVREYEPAIALTDGADGLSFYRTIAASAGGLLQSHGAVIVEIGEGQAEAVRALLEERGRFGHVATWRDSTGGHERVMQFRVAGT